MGLLHFVALAAAPPQPVQAGAQAQVTIRVLKHATASARSWHSASQRSERTIRDATGSEFLLRTIDFE